MTRTRDLLFAGLFSVLALGLPGCDLSTSSTSGRGADLNVVGGGEGTLPVAAGEPILSADGVFELYYAADDFGDAACVSAWVRNTGPALATWKISVGLDRAITNSTYSGAGDNLVFLYARELVVVPQNATKLRSGDVVSIRYCAEPASMPVDVVVTAGSSDGTAPDGGPATPVLISGDFALYQSVANDWETGGCVQVALRNGGPAVTGWSLRLQLDTPIDVLSSQWGAAIHNTGTSQKGQFDVFPTDASQVLDKGSAVTFGYCSEPLAFVSSISELKFVVEPVDPTPPPVAPFSAGDFTAEGGKIMLSYTAPEADGDDWCYYVTFRNVTEGVLKPSSLKVLMAADFDAGVTSTWPTPAFKSGPAELTYKWADASGMAPGAGYSDHLCMTGAVQKPRKLFVVY